MSIHPSLSGVDTLTGERSVFTRVERIQKLIDAGKLEEEGSPYGLPKVRTHFKVKSAKKAEAAEDTESTEGEAGEAEASE